MVATNQEQDQRRAALARWVSGVLARDCQLVALGGDAGARRYFTLAQQPALLAVDAPPESENTAQFMRVADMLRQRGIRVPEVQAADAEKGFLLVEHLGQTLLADAVTADTAPLLYGEALFTLLGMAQIPTAGAQVPVYDRAFVLRELEIFRQWFVSQLLGITLSDAEQLLCDSLFELLAQAALAQPQVFMHRDYHSRNILLLEQRPVVIDFQDAVIGPVTYDLVSLLKDCYLKLPVADRRRWALVYGDLARDAGLIDPPSAEAFLRDFDWVGLQRHLKVLGIFARLALRDNKPRYLNDLPRVLGYVLEVLDGYTELSDFGLWFRTRVMPACEQSGWFLHSGLDSTAYPAPAAQGESP